MSYAEIVGVWIDQPVGSPVVPSSTAQPIEWPRGSDGTIVLRLIDALGEAVLLGGGDSLWLNIAESTCERPLRRLQAASTAEPGRYLFTLVPDDTRDTPAGALVYDACAQIGGKWQQVVQPGYFVTTPTVPG